MKRFLKTWWVALSVLAFFVGWVIFVRQSGAGHYLFGDDWDFELTGQLGDSFGVIGAVGAAFAAIFTYRTLMDTQELASRERAELQLREMQRVESDARRDAETIFFRLLEARTQVLNDIRLGDVRGNEATAALVEYIRDYNKFNRTRRTIKTLYMETYLQKRNDLGHYFRLTYHIVLHAASKMKATSYDHLRILRAQMSNSELILLALNCAHGEGRKKFKPLVERYALLHNIDPADRIKFKLDDHFKARAFGLPSRRFRVEARPKPFGDQIGPIKRGYPVELIVHVSKTARG